MPKFPDFSDLTKKLDLQGMVDGVKSVLNPEHNLPDPIEGDELAHKMITLLAHVKNIADRHTEQGKEIEKLAKQMNQVYNEYITLQKAQSGKPEAEPPAEKPEEPEEK